MRSDSVISVRLKRRLVDEIYHLLEHNSSQVSSILKKAIRLAEACGDMEHRLLFDIHLDGVDLTGASGARIEKWPDPNQQPKWDILPHFYKTGLPRTGKAWACL